MTDREKLIERFAERLKEAYPQSDRNNPDHAIYYDDFCDIVDEVAAEITDSIAHGVTVQEWISVKDRLPEKSGLVIGYDIVWGVGCFYYHTDMQTPTWRQITHWMPLPQPPKGE